jgi:hypothetical protein
MAETTTKPTAVDAAGFIAAVANPRRRADAECLCALMARVTGETATMWGRTIIGFGAYHYRYASGHEGDMCRVGFAPRAANLALYVGGFPELETLLGRLGRIKRAKSCIYVTKMSDVDIGVLEEIVRRAFEATVDIDKSIGR